MTIKGGTNKACAACKYQRRKCSKDCPLAPYFPADKPKTFSNAHRLFGVCNIMRILKQVKPDERDEAMKSIIFESDMRAKYPDVGCYGVMMRYQDLLYESLEELRYIQKLIASCKEILNSQHLVMPACPIDECSIPVYNYDKFSLFNGNAICDGDPYNESKHILLTSPCSSGITSVSNINGVTKINDISVSNINGLTNITDISGITGNNASVIDVKPDLKRVQTLSYHEDAVNAGANVMDAKSNLMLMQGSSYDEELNSPADFTNCNGNFMDGKDAKFDLMRVKGLSPWLSDIATANASVNAKDAKSNLMLMQGSSYDEELNAPAELTNSHANVMDAKCAKFDLMKVQGPFNYNGRYTFR